MKLECNKTWFTFNEAAFSYLKKMKLPKKWIDLFDHGDKFDENDLYDLLKKNVTSQPFFQKNVIYR